jgi:hypothetical protein
MERKATLEVTFEVGLLSRRRVEKSIRKFCSLHDIDLQMRETNGWLFSRFSLRACGEPKGIGTLREIMEKSEIELVHP